MSTVTRPTGASTEWASDATVNNGANNTANKVEPSASHKAAGWGYPEQPPRNYMNWWMNAVYKWVDYFDSWIQKWGSFNKNFAINDSSTTGLVFAYNAGKVSYGVGSQASVSAGSITLSDGNGTYTIYFDHATGTVNKLVGSTPTSSDSILPLYSVPVVSGAIDTANIVDLRTFTLLKKASVSEVTAGTDNDKYVTPAALVGFATPSATTSVFGKVRLADSADLSAQAGNNVLTAGNLADANIHASLVKYGTVRFASAGEIATQSSEGVITAADLATAGMWAGASRYGFVRLADNTDLIPANRASSYDALTAASLTYTDMQASTSRTGVLSLATAAEVGAGTDNTKAVTPLALAGQKQVLTGQVLNTPAVYTFAHSLGTRPSRVDFFLECLGNDGGYTAGDWVPMPLHQAIVLTDSSERGYAIKIDAANVYISIDTNHYIDMHQWNDTSRFRPATGNWKMHFTVYK